MRYLSLMEVLSNTGAIVPLQDISDGIKDFTYLTGRDGRRARQMIAFEPPECKSTQRLWAIHGTHQNGSLYLWGSVQPEEKSSGEMYLARVRPSR